MKFNFTDPETGTASLQKRLETLANWEQHRADGKWFWLFKRSAIWLTTVLVLFGTGSFLFPEMINFQGPQIFIAVFMFGGYFIGSLNEWSKMEKLFQSQSYSSE